MLEEAGLHNVLAAKLASFVVATGCSLRGSNGFRPSAILPAPEKAELVPILGAVIAINGESSSRWKRFLDTPAFEQVFPKTYPEGPTNFSSGRTTSNHIETLIPHLQSASRNLPNTSYPNFPPLSAFSTPLQASFRNSGLPIESSDGAVISYESPLVPWLVYMGRADIGALARLMAIQAVTYIHGCNLTHKCRDAEFAITLVPLLSAMLDKGPARTNSSSSASSPKDRSTDQQQVEERAPAVLAKLTCKSPDLQRAAVEAGSIKKLSQLLKRSFDSLPPHHANSLWTPEPLDAEEMETSEESTLGNPGISPAAYHITLIRAAALEGLAAIASLNDDYRKSIIDNNVVQYIIQSMKPYDTQIFANQSRLAAEDSKSSTIVTENTTDVLHAACSLARALSRSVSTLRTSLMDAGLGAPLFQLLKHQDIEIQIAATAVASNIVLEFSPMRDVSPLPLPYNPITRANLISRSCSNMA